MLVTFLLSTGPITAIEDGRSPLHRDLHLQKVADDSAAVGCISESDEMEYQAVVDSSVTWCEQNHLQLSVTKALIVDFRRTRKAATCVSNQGVNVDTVKDYKYLRVHIK